MTFVDRTFRAEVPNDCIEDFRIKGCKPSSQNMCRKSSSAVQDWTRRLKQKQKCKSNKENSFSEAIEV